MVASDDASRADTTHLKDPGSTARTVLDDKDISRALTRITHEILERNRDASDVVLLGIPTRGVHLARRIANRMSEVEGREIIAGALDITMFRDDLRLKPCRFRGQKSPDRAQRERQGCLDRDG